MMEINDAIKLQIIEQEIATYRNTQYLFEIRYRVNKKLGNNAEQLKPIEDELAKIESILDELEKVKAELLPKKEKA